MAVIPYPSGSVAAQLAIAPACGLPAINFAGPSFLSDAQTCAQNAKPPGSPADFVVVCTAQLMARGIIYYKQAPGDCGSPTQIDPSTEDIAVGIGSMVGSQIPGIGPFVAGIGSIFGAFGAAHQQAVETEQATICKVAGLVNQLFAYYDALVRAGKVSPSVAYTGIQSFISQLNAQLQTIYKSCNASCVYQGVLSAHAAFVQIYYPAIAPVSFFQTKPASPPSQWGTNPGGTATAYPAPAAPGAAPGQVNSYPGGLLAPSEGIVANPARTIPASFIMILAVLFGLFIVGLAALT